MIKEKFYGKIEQQNIKIDPNELAARLKTARGYTDSVIENCEKLLRKNVDVRYSAVRLDASYPKDDVIDFGFCRVESKDLYKNLDHAPEVYFMAVTLGMKTDLLLKRMSVTSSAELYVTDALASAFTEAAADKTEEIIKNNAECRPRYSPGYGDLKLEFEADLLYALEAGKLLGITLSESMLMTPQKTITAVVGIK